MGRTPLHLACESGNVECVIWLIDKKANVNAQSLSGMMPLHVACRDKHVHCVKALLSQKDQLVDIDEEDSRRKTPEDYGTGEPLIHDEFRRYRIVRRQLFKEELLTRYVGPLFELYGINGDGVITLDEFVSLERQYVEILGLPTPTDQMIADTFKKYDKDGNKKLDFQESAAEFMTLVYV